MFIVSFRLFQCPMFKMEGDKQVPEPFAEEAKYFSECRLLQRDVQIILEGVSNQFLLGSIQHPVSIVLCLTQKSV